MNEPRLANPNDYVIYECSAQGCSNRIRCRIGYQFDGPPVCRWCEGGESHVMRKMKEAEAEHVRLKSVL